MVELIKLNNKTTGGVDYNTDISALYNTNILTAITPGTMQIEIDDVTDFQKIFALVFYLVVL